MIVIVAGYSGSVRLFTFTNTSFGGGALAATIGRGYTGGNNLDLGTALEASDLFGSSVSLNAAGDRLAVGAIGDAGFGNAFRGFGSVRIFSFGAGFTSGAIVSTLGAGYVGAGDLDLQTLGLVRGFGQAVAFDAAGERLALGSINFRSNTGAVHLFTRAAPAVTSLAFATYPDNGLNQRKQPRRGSADAPPGVLNAPEVLRPLNGTAHPAQPSQE